MGDFYGSVRKWTNEPDGYGVFFPLKSGWIHMGKVEGGKFTEGRKGSVSLFEETLKLTNINIQADGTVLQKIELYCKGE
jgi:hypothetical protein